MAPLSVWRGSPWVGSNPNPCILYPTLPCYTKPCFSIPYYTIRIIMFMWSLGAPEEAAKSSRPRLGRALHRVRPDAGSCNRAQHPKSWANPLKKGAPICRNSHISIPIYICIYIYVYPCIYILFQQGCH